MAFPQPKPKTLPPIFTTYCIDYRYDALSAEFLRKIGYGESYFLATTAGSALALGYKQYCKNNCCNKKDKCGCKDKCHCKDEKEDKCHCKDNKDKKDKKAYCKVCPKNKTLNLLKDGLIANLNIALTLRPITTYYLLNHQDCGAIRAFLPCSGYPGVDEVNKHKEICINARLLTYARDTVKEEFEGIEAILGLIDVNGTVADYDAKTKKWKVIFIGAGTDVNGLWFGRTLGEVFAVPCSC